MIKLYTMIAGLREFSIHTHAIPSEAKIESSVARHKWVRQLMKDMKKRINWRNIESHSNENPTILVLGPGDGPELGVFRHRSVFPQDKYDMVAVDLETPPLLSVIAQKYDVPLLKQNINPPEEVLAAITSPTDFNLPFPSLLIARNIEITPGVFLPTELSSPQARRLLSKGCTPVKDGSPYIKLVNTELEVATLEMTRQIIEKGGAAIFTTFSEFEQDRLHNSLQATGLQPTSFINIGRNTSANTKMTHQLSLNDTRVLPDAYVTYLSAYN